MGLRRRSPGVTPDTAVAHCTGRRWIAAIALASLQSSESKPHSPHRSTFTFPILPYRLGCPTLPGRRGHWRSGEKPRRKLHFPCPNIRPGSSIGSVNRRRRSMGGPPGGMVDGGTMVRPPPVTCPATPGVRPVLQPSNDHADGGSCLAHPIRSILSVLWALLPAMTVGFLAGPCILVASIRLRSGRLGMFAALYCALSVTVVLLVWNQPTGSWRMNAAVLISFSAAIVGTFHCFAVRAQLVSGEHRVQSGWLDKRPGEHVFRGSRRSRVEAGCAVLAGSVLTVAGFLIHPTSSWSWLGNVLAPAGVVMALVGLMSLTAKVVVYPSRIKSVWHFRSRSFPIDRVRAIDLAQKWTDGEMIWIPLVILDDRSEKPLTVLSLPLSSDSSRQRVSEDVRTLRSLIGVGGTDRT